MFLPQKESEVFRVELSLKFPWQLSWALTAARLQGHVRARLGLLVRLRWPAACVYDSCPQSSPWPFAPLVVPTAAKESCSSWATSSSMRTVGSVSSSVVSTSTVTTYCREQLLSRHCHLHQVLPSYTPHPDILWVTVPPGPVSPPNNHLYLPLHNHLEKDKSEDEWWTNKINLKTSI